jgi:hypothetical protein
LGRGYTILDSGDVGEVISDMIGDRVLKKRGVDKNCRQITKFCEEFNGDVGALTDGRLCSNDCDFHISNSNETETDSRQMVRRGGDTSLFLDPS